MIKLKNTIKFILILLVLNPLFSSTSFAQGSINGTGWDICKNNNGYLYNYNAQTPEIAFDTQGYSGGTLSTYTGVVPAGCAISANRTLLKSSNTSSILFFAVFDHADQCGLNSTFNITNSNCDCNEGYEPNTAQTSCVLIEETPPEPCSQLSPDPIALTVQVTSDASSPPTVNPMLYEYGGYDGCRYVINNPPTTPEDLFCFTLTGDTAPKAGYCNFNYTPTFTSENVGEPDLNADMSNLADNETCEGNATKNDFGMCQEDITVECDSETEWHNYGNNTCEPKQECNEDQEYFFDEVIQGCQDLACPSGEFRPSAGQPCQQEGTCQENQVSLGLTCTNKACPTGQYRVTNEGACQAIPAGHILVPSPFPDPTTACAAETGLTYTHQANTRDYRWSPNANPNKSNWSCRPTSQSGLVQLLQNVCAAYSYLTANPPTHTPAGFNRFGYGEGEVSNACQSAGFTQVVNNISCFDGLPNSFNAQNDCQNIAEISQLYNEGYSPSNTAIVQSGSCPAGQHVSNNQWCIDDECTSDPYHEGNCNDSGQTGGDNGGGENGSCEGDDCAFDGENLDGKLDAVKAQYIAKLNDIKTQFGTVFTPLTNGTADLPIYEADITIGNKVTKAKMDTSSGSLVFDQIGVVLLMLGGVLSVFIVLSGLKG